MDTKTLTIPGLEPTTQAITPTHQREDDTKKLFHKEIADELGVSVEYVSAMHRAGMPWRPTRSQLILWLLANPQFTRKKGRAHPRIKQIQERLQL